MLRYIEIDENKIPLHQFKTEDDKRKYSKLTCDTFSSASLLIPKNVVVLDFDEDNIVKDNNGNIISNKEKFLIDYLIEKYHPYWTKSQNNHYHLYFKKPSHIKIYNWANYFTCGGFQIDYRSDNNGLAVVKVNDKMRECKEELTEEVINNLPELPILCYPLHYNANYKTCFIDMKDHDGRNTMLFNHTKEIYRKYQFKSQQLLEICNFINNHLFKEPLSDKEIESFSNRAKDYAFKSESIIYDENYNSDIDLICFDDVKYKKASWLWYPYLPLGRLVLVVGDPGTGKSYLTIDWASRVSKGEPFPFYDEDKGIDEIKPSKVIFQNGEDGIEDTIKERLIVSEANQENIYIINEIDNPLFNLNDLERFEKALKEQSPRLVIIDPLQRYLGNISMNSASEVRQLLAPIGNLAIKYNCTIILVMHKNKSKTNDIYRALGSIDFVGIARSMLTIQIDDFGNKEIVHTKSSLGKKGNTILYDILDNGIVYLDQIETIDLSVDSLKPREEAKDFILNVLKENNGSVSAVEITTRAKELDISTSTLNRAKKELKIKSTQIQGKWYWELELKEEDTQSHEKNNENVIK
jgi:archaellum biogenesis ATPase FlaH